MRATLIWAALAAAVTVPMGVSATSPLLAWRDPVYILAGFAGVVSLGLLLVQPLLAGGYLPGLNLRKSRTVHRGLGIALVVAVLVHVGGLWITSPPDVVDALLFTSPTPFSDWGVIAMWAVFAAALLAACRRRLRPAIWRLGHTALVVLVVITTVLHAVLIEGTMGTASKILLCALVVITTVKVVMGLKAWTYLSRPRA